MTTFDPGASVVLTHGLRSSPASTAFFASSAAPTITEGLDVLVQDVIAAMTTEPWSTDVWVPSSRVTSAGRVGLPAGPADALAAVAKRPLSPPFSLSATYGSEAGNVPA